MSQNRGHAMVEFALAIPVFALLLLAGFDVGLLAVQQFSLERTCFSVARQLASSSLESPDQLLAYAHQLLEGNKPTEAQVRIHALPTKTSSSPLRAPKIVEVLEVFLEQNPVPRFPLLQILTGSVPFHLQARVREARVRVLEGGSL